MKNWSRACGLYLFDQNCVKYDKCVQNVLEKVVYMSDQEDGFREAFKRELEELAINPEALLKLVK